MMTVCAAAFRATVVDKSLYRLVDNKSDKMQTIEIEFGIANTEYRYIGIKISVNTGITSAFGVFLRKQIEQRNAGKNMF